MNKYYMIILHLTLCIYQPIEMHAANNINELQCTFKYMHIINNEKPVIET